MANGAPHGPRGDAPALPLEVVGHDGRPEPRRRLPRWLLALPVALLLVATLLVATGGVVGLSFEPAALGRLLAATGLAPGGGTGRPVARPPDAARLDRPAASARPTEVVGLARLLPEGDVVVVAPPYGSGDARVRAVLVEEGDQVERGEPVALMDSLGRLRSAVATAAAEVAVAEARVIQVRRSVETSLMEARAGLERAQAAAEETARDLARTEALRERGVASEAALDAARSGARQADRAVAAAGAILSRFEDEDEDEDAQPDVLVAQAELGAARARLSRARRDLDEARVLAPVAGTVLEVFVRPGERPGSEGILEIGATDAMMAEVEVYQSDVGRIAPGQPVGIAADALGRRLAGTVERVGLTVGRQAVVGDDVAASTDARVVRVLVRLDEASSAAASRLTGLEALARIDTGAEGAALARAGAGG